MTRSAAVGEAASSRLRTRVLYGPVLTLAVGLCAALPVIAAMVRALHEGYQPVADRGIIATRSFDVFSSHTPLVGQYSFAGAVTGKLTYSFGPMLYWLLAPAAHVGAPASFVVTMAIVNVACVLGAVALARRRGGVWLMVAAAAGIGLMCRSIAANNFYDIWNPSAGLFPLLALIFVAWSLACGDYRLLPVGALLASFELQCEDSFVPAALGLSAVALAGLALWRLRSRREPASGRGARRRPRVWRWALAAALVFAVCWTPTVVDQVAHEGNFVHVLQAATERSSSLGASVGLHAVERTVGVRPWWLVRPSDPFVRKRDVLHSPGAVAVASAALLLGWLLVAAALAARRRRWDVTAGAATALVLCLAVYSIASATPTKRMLAETLGYTLWSATTVGMFAWLMALWAAVALTGADELLAAAVRTRGRRARRSPSAWSALAKGLAASAALALAGLAGAVGAAAGTADEHAFEFHALSTINARLGAVPRGHSVFLNARLDGLITPLRPEMTYELRRRGVRALGVGAYLRTGHWYERSEHRYDYVVWVYDNRRLPVAGAKVIAVAHITTGGRPHTIEVALSHVPPRAARPAASASGGRRARLAATAAAGAAPLPTGSAASGWSAPHRLGRCAAAGPAVVFPSSAPSIPSGPGAVVWASAASGCAAGSASAASGWTLSASALSDGERAGRVSAGPLAGLPPALLQAVGGSRGRISALASAAVPRAGEGFALLQGRAGRGRMARLLAGGAPAVTLARAYLGDATVAAVTRAPAIAVRVQRYFRSGFALERPIAIGPSPLSALAATMDYRADVLVAWQQSGAIYAHMLRASGRADPTQRLGSSAPDPQLRALVSDDDHGMVAWSSTRTSASGQPHTTTFIDLSGAGVRFAAPRRLASFGDPSRAGASPGALALVRLSSENVLLAWTTRERGHYLVRAAPAVYAGTRPSAVLSDARATQSVLGDLAAGPAGEAIAVWRASHGTAFDPQRAELWSARAFIARHDRPAAAPPRQLAGAGASGSVSVGVDPANDRAVAAWLAGGPRGAVEYASAAGAPGYRPRAASAALPRPSRGTHWLRITLAAAVGAGLIAAAGLAAARRRRRVLS